MTPEQLKAKELVDKYLNKKKGTIPFPELLPPITMSDSSIAFCMLWQTSIDNLKKYVDDNVGISKEREGQIAPRTKND